MKKCLLFDSDGTLVDSEYLNCEAMVAELRVAGIVEDTGELFRSYSGWKFSAVLDELQKRHKQSLDDSFTDRFRQRASQHFEGRLRAIEHIPEVLLELDHPKCVASNAPVTKIKHALALTGLSRFFGSAIYSAYDVGNWKPEPDLFLHAAEQMGFDPTQCIVIEDSEVGVSAALAAGIDVVQYDPSGKAVDQSGVLLIRSMRDLPGALNQLA